MTLPATPSRAGVSQRSRELVPSIASPLSVAGGDASLTQGKGLAPGQLICDKNASLSPIIVPHLGMPLGRLVAGIRTASHLAAQRAKNG
jgi:hypothetical protein